MAVKGLLYTKNHEWVSIEGADATVGITDYAQEQLGELVFVDLPVIGKQVIAQDEIAIVESSKAASDVYSPVTGKVRTATKKAGSLNYSSRIRRPARICWTRTNTKIM